MLPTAFAARARINQFKPSSTLKAKVSASPRFRESVSRAWFIADPKQPKLDSSMKNPVPPSETLTQAERYKNLSTRQVQAYIGAECRETVWEYVRLGKLPKPRYISPHRPLWRLGEVVDVLERNLKTSDEGKRGFRGDVKPEQQAPKKSNAQRLRERFGIGD